MHLRKLTVPALAATLLLGLTSSAAAQSYVKTKSGRVYDCTILSTDDQRLQIRTRDGEMLTLPFANLDPKTLYQINLGRIGDDDGPGQLELGDEAAACGLWSNAKRHYDTAVKDDPSLQDQVDSKIAALRSTASSSLLDQAKSEDAHGRPEVAEKHLTTLLTNFPHEDAADEAGTMLTDIHEQQDAKRKAEIAAKHSQAVQDALAPAQKNYDEMRQKIQDGLKNSKNQSRSIDDFKAAVKEGEEGRKHLASLSTDNDADLASAAQELDGELVDQIVNADIQLASAYNQRTSYNDAYKVVNDALALQPDNKELINLRSQISSNTATDSFGGWYGRPNRPIRR